MVGGSLQHGSIHIKGSSKTLSHASGLDTCVCLGCDTAVPCREVWYNAKFCLCLLEWVFVTRCSQDSRSASRYATCMTLYGCYCRWQSRNNTAVVRQSHVYTTRRISLIAYIAAPPSNACAKAFTSVMGSQQQIKLWELVGEDTQISMSHLVWRVRLLLAYKGQTYESIPWRFTEKDAIKPFEKVHAHLLRTLLYMS